MLLGAVFMIIFFKEMSQAIFLAFLEHKGFDINAFTEPFFLTYVPF